MSHLFNQVRCDLGEPFHEPLRKRSVQPLCPRKDRLNLLGKLYKSVIEIASLKMEDAIAKTPENGKALSIRQQLVDAARGRPYLLIAFDQVLTAASEGSIFAGPVRTTPPIGTGGEWPRQRSSLRRSHSAKPAAPSLGDKPVSGKGRAACSLIEYFGNPR